MNAVNLIPPDLRRAGSGGGSGSAAGPYALLAALALAVALVGFWAVTTRQVKDREAEVARLNAEAAEAERQAGNLSSYEAVVKAAQKRRQTVVDLMDQRIDWSGALEDVSRTIPSNVWISQMAATAAPTVTVEGGPTLTQRATQTGPAVELSGCTTSQAEVARLMARLRAMKGVTSVSLSASEKSETAGGTSSASAAGGGQSDCSQASRQRPKFGIVVFYGEGSDVPGPSTATKNQAATAAVAQEPAGGAK